MTSIPEISPNTRVALLLCARFGVQSLLEKPLTQSEFHKLNNHLLTSGLTLELLPGMKNGALASLCNGLAEICPARLAVLLGRTKDLDEACAIWAKAGIWVLGEKDKGYPSRLRQRFKLTHPPLLFGAGRIEFLDRGGVCIVGSRDSPKAALNFSARLAARCCSEKLTVITSDMRGVDREAVSSALKNSGHVVVVLSDRLEKVVLAKRYRHALAEGLMTMVTPFSPSAGFSVANAIRVNRYQYALSDVAVVVETRSKGGIWLGADENRKERWVPAFVRSDRLMASGNSALLHLGLSPLTIQDIENIDNLEDFFTSYAVGQNGSNSQATAGTPHSHKPLNLYSVFLSEFLTISAVTPKSQSDIVKHFGIEPNQALIWLRQAKFDGLIQKIEGGDSEMAWTSCSNIDE